MHRPHPRVKALAAIAERMLGDMEGNAAARRIHAEANRLRAGADALDRAAANRNPLDTPEAHIKKIATMARKLDQEITASINRAGAAFHDGMQDVQRRIDEKVDLKPDAFAAEIRATFRTLSAEEKGKLVKNLVDGNRGPELAAIVKAPSVLTGISDERRAAYEASIVGKHAAAEVQERERLNDVFDALSTATRTAIQFVTSLTDPGRVAAIERGEAAASAAGEAFNQSLQ